MLAQRLREQEHVLSVQAQKALDDKDATVQHVLSSALQAQTEELEEEKKAFEHTKTAEIQAKLDEHYSTQLANYKEQVLAELQQKNDTLQSLQDKLQALQQALESSQSSQKGSSRAHRISAAALALSEKLDTSLPAGDELQALQWAAGKDGVISTAVKTIPATVAQGVPTVAELQGRFVEKLYTKCRQAALVPQGRPGLEGQLAGMLFATVKYPPSPDEPSPDPDNAEYLLAQAKSFVQMGHLEEAVSVLDKLQGQAAFTIADWKKDAVDRINVDKARKVIKMECALLNESLA